MTCTRCGCSVCRVLHVIDDQLRQAAVTLGEQLEQGSVCSACLRVLLRTPAERAPYLKRSA
jgi:hypothetical protein